MPSHGSLPTHFRGVIITVPWLAHLFTADVLLSLLLPFKPLFPSLVYNVSSFLAYTVWSGIQNIFTTLNGAKITFSGDQLPREESAIVISNHVAWSDFYMIQALAAKSGMLGCCRYFAKKQLRYVPFLGWGLWAMGMPMVTRNWLRDRRELDRVFSKLVRGRHPLWLISFSEATRLTPRKFAESEAWCEKNGKPQPQHLLYPRTKGFVATVQNLRKAPHVKAVYDLTIAYREGKQFQRPPSFWDTLSVPRLTERWGLQFHVHARRFPLELLPNDDDELARWLEERWVEKGQWLEEWRQS